MLKPLIPLASVVYFFGSVCGIGFQCFNSNLSYGVKTLLPDDYNLKFCSDSFTTPADQINKCISSCSAAGLLIGTRDAAFDATGMQEIYSDVVDTNYTRFHLCEIKSRALDDIEASVKDFLVEVQQFRMRLIENALLIEENIENAKKKFLDPSFVRALQSANDEDRVKEYKVLVEDILKTPSTSHLVGLLKTKSAVLKQSLTDNVPVLDDFLSNCNRFYHERNVVQYQCRVRQEKCPEVDGSSWCSCGCLDNPILGATMKKVNKANGRVSSSQTTIQSSNFQDVCHRVKEESSALDAKKTESKAKEAVKIYQQVYNVETKPSPKASSSSRSYLLFPGSINLSPLRLVSCFCFFWLL